MTDKVITVKKISFSKNFLDQLKELLANYQPNEFLRGVPIKKLEMVPKQYTESGFLVFLVKKSGRRTILKIVWDKQFQFRYQAEVFVYENLVKQKEIGRLLPKLLAKKEKTIPFFEIDYLNDYKPLGDDHHTVVKLTNSLVDTIISALSTFHKLKVSPRSFLHQQRTVDFYQEKLNNLSTAKRVEKYFGTEIKNQLINLLNQNYFKRSSTNQFILGDRNPSNIFVNQQKELVKFVDFDRVGFGSPALDYTYLHLGSSDQPSAIKQLLSRLDQIYTSIDDFWPKYWYDLLIRCVDEMSYWQDRDLYKFKLLKSIFEKTLLKLV